MLKRRRRRTKGKRKEKSVPEITGEPPRRNFCLVSFLLLLAYIIDANLLNISTIRHDPALIGELDFGGFINLDLVKMNDEFNFREDFGDGD